MKGAFLFSAAGLLGSAVAHQHGHGHQAHHILRRGTGTGAPGPAHTCGCTTRVITVTGPATLVPEPVTEMTTTVHSTSYQTVTVSVTEAEPESTKAKPEPTEAPSESVSLPTPIVTVYPTPGTYTIEPTTVVVTKETTVCAATSTGVSPGEHTYGGVTTVVKTATTVTCPVATVKPSGSTSVSVIETTTYVCPSAGTYTIAPTTTSVPKSTVIVYPTPATYTPGTYTQPGHTVTVTDTDYVYVCPTEAPSNSPAPSTPAQPTSPPQPPKETEQPPKETEQPPKETPQPPKETPQPPKESKPAPSPKPEPSSKPEPPKLGGGNKWGMTYSPYSDDGQCKGAAEVAKDIAIIKSKGFKVVRVYAPDCDGLKNIGSACKKVGLRMIAGIFIDGNGIEGGKKQLKELKAWGQWENVDLIVLGNEAVFSGKVTITELVKFITLCKSELKAAGYTGQFTTTEPINIWQEKGKPLCEVVDVLGANLHPFFNAEVSASKAGEFVAAQMKDLKNVCGGKDVVNLETGWPNGGGSNGKALSGTKEQATAIASIMKAVGDKSIFFSFRNDRWKEAGPLGIEQNWGCVDAF